jgi:hypothetical protein
MWSKPGSERQRPIIKKMWKGKCGRNNSWSFFTIVERHQNSDPRIPMSYKQDKWQKKIHQGTLCEAAGNHVQTQDNQSRQR